MVYFRTRTLNLKKISFLFAKTSNIATFSKTIWSTSNLKYRYVVCAVTNPCYKEQCRHILPGGFYDRAGLGFNLPGQGLKKNLSEEEEKKSLVLQFINKKIEEQKRGKQKLPLLPDYKFLFRCLVNLTLVIFVIYLVLPDIKALVFQRYSLPCDVKAYDSIKLESTSAYIYASLPLRFISRMFGRLMNLKLNSFSRFPALYSFCYLTGANLNEAVETDFKRYRSIGAFFRRQIKPELRPIDFNSDIVSPSDGKVLVSGAVKNCQLEQVKNVTYSLPKFLGPLQPDASENFEFSKVSNEAFRNSLMHDPSNNDLFQCVVYLSPKDYHGFHSPVNWTIKNRRHFPGELLSVNPKMVSRIKDLFVLNERVVLSGEWKHGFFSLTAVGATNVGSIKIYCDPVLHTNQLIFTPGSYYDWNLADEEIKLKKGDPVGEFNMGSSVVLLFEAPKDFSFDLQDNQNVKYGESLEKTKS